MVQDEEMDFEGHHVDENRQDDEARDSGTPMSALVTLQGLVDHLASSAQQVKPHTTDIFKSPNLSHRSSIVYRPTKAVTKRPIHFTLVEYLALR